MRSIVDSDGISKKRTRLGAWGLLISDDSIWTELGPVIPYRIQPFETQSSSRSRPLIRVMIKSFGICSFSLSWPKTCCKYYAFWDETFKRQLSKPLIRRAKLESVSFSRCTSCLTLIAIKLYLDARRIASVALPDPRGPMMTTRAVRLPFDRFGWPM